MITVMNIISKTTKIKSAIKIPNTGDLILIILLMRYLTKMKKSIPANARFGQKFSEFIFTSNFTSVLVSLDKLFNLQIANTIRLEVYHIIQKSQEYL